ncbi:MAG: hypothetical protein ACRD26_23410 [Vicinamibacterales bacterium]
MTKPPASDPRGAAARFWLDVIEGMWRNAVTASHALSDALLQASSAPLHTNGRAGEAADVARLEEIPREALERFFGVYEDQAPPAMPVAPAASRVIAEAHAYLGSSGGRAGLQEVVAHVAEQTGYDRARVQAMILRHLPCDGERVWRSAAGPL